MKNKSHFRVNLSVITLFALLSTGCTQEDFSEHQTNVIEENNSNARLTLGKRTIEEAADIAAKAIGMISSDSRADASHTFNPQDSYERDPSTGTAEMPDYNNNIIYFTITR